MSEVGATPAAPSSAKAASRYSKLSFLLRLAAFFTLTARGWLYWRWDSPLRDVFWHEAWMQGPVDFWLGLDWYDYASGSDPYLTLLFRLIGIFWASTGIACLLIGRGHRRGHDALLVASGLLFAHHFAAWSAKDFQVGMLLEMFLQSFSPVFLWLHLRGFSWKVLRYIALIACSLTFIGHGLYAIGLHPLPAAFVTMSMNTLGLSQSTATLFLKAAAWLDFAAALLIFVPWQRLRLGALGYMVFWGALTALARVVANYSPALAYHGLDPWLAETLVRTTHWMIPLWLLLSWRRPALSSQPEPKI